jgi:hypothetical protein
MGEGVLQMESLSGLRGAASASSVSFTGGASSCGCSAPFQCAIPRDLSLEPAALSTRASKSISRAWTLRRDLCASFSASVNSSSRLCWSSASARVVRNFCSQSAQRRSMLYVVRSIAGCMLYVLLQASHSTHCIERHCRSHSATYRHGPYASICAADRIGMQKNDKL